MKLKSSLATDVSPVTFESALEAMIINEFGVYFKYCTVYIYMYIVLYHMVSVFSLFPFTQHCLF